MRTKSEVLKGMNLTEFNFKCSYDFKFFYENMLGITDFGGLQSYMLEWFNLIRDNDRVMIQAPSNFAKTTVLETIALFFVWNNENKKVMIIANTDEMAKTIVGNINTMINENELINELRPKDYRETWNKKELRTTTGCKIFCKPYTPNMRGERSDFTLVDEADAEVYRNTKIFKEHVLSRLNPEAKLVLISTPDSTTGLMSYLRNTDEHNVWTFRKYPAIINMKVEGDYSSGESLWEERFPLNILLKMKEEEGDAFEKIRMCDDKAETEDSLFKLKYILDCYDERFKFEQKSKGGLTVISCDFAYSTHRDADDTVYVVIEKLKGFYIIRNIIELPKGIKLPEKIAIIRDLFEQYKHRLDDKGNKLEPIIVCDGTNVGSDVVDGLYSEGLAVVDESFSVPERKDMYKILQNVIENKKLIIPRDKRDEECIRLTDLLTEQLIGFVEVESPTGAYKSKILKSNAAHDDIAASLAMGIKELSKQITESFY